MRFNREIQKFDEPFYKPFKQRIAFIFLFTVVIYFTKLSAGKNRPSLSFRILLVFKNFATACIGVQKRSDSGMNFVFWFLNAGIIF